METWKGRPDITPTDHPLVIFKALRDSYGTWSKEHTKEQTEYWYKQAQDSYEALQDSFGIIDEDRTPLRPGGKARLYMSMDDLEYAIVGYGVELLENQPENYEQELAEVDAVLNAIDKALQRNKSS